MKDFYTDIDLKGHKLQNATLDGAAQGKIVTFDANGRMVPGDAPQGGGAQAQADWNQTNAQAADFIKNKPSLRTYLKTVCVNSTMREADWCDIFIPASEHRCGDYINVSIILSGKYAAGNITTHDVINPEDLDFWMGGDELTFTVDIAQGNILITSSKPTVQAFYAGSSHIALTFTVQITGYGISTDRLSDIHTFSVDEDGNAIVVKSDGGFWNLPQAFQDFFDNNSRLNYEDYFGNTLPRPEDDVWNIPSSVRVDGGNHQVTEISDELFYNSISPEGLILPDTLTRIGTRAFTDWYPTKNLYVYNHCLYIGSGTNHYMVRLCLTKEGGEYAQNDSEISVHPSCVLDCLYQDLGMYGWAYEEATGGWTGW